MSQASQAAKQQSFNKYLEKLSDKEFGQCKDAPEGNLGFVKDQMDLDAGSRVGSFCASQRAFGQLQTADDDAVISNAHVKLESDVLCSSDTFKKDGMILNGASGLKSSSQDSCDKSLVSKKRKSKIDKKLAAA